ncbi:MAG TPA: hypothetical protein VII06_33830 [Chloroflexota bacterium]|jgi:hypothetical protein
MWCAYPHCFREASARCVTCGRQYCPNHCAPWVYGGADRVHECELCQQHLTPAQLRAQLGVDLVTSVSAVSMFLVAVAVGIAADVAAKGPGLIVLTVFSVAFLLMTRCVSH